MDISKEYKEILKKDKPTGKELGRLLLYDYSKRFSDRDYKPLNMQEQFEKIIDRPQEIEEYNHYSLILNIIGQYANNGFSNKNEAINLLEKTYSILRDIYISEKMTDIYNSSPRVITQERYNREVEDIKDSDIEDSYRYVNLLFIIGEAYTYYVNLASEDLRRKNPLKNIVKAYKDQDITDTAAISKYKISRHLLNPDPVEEDPLEIDLYKEFSYINKALERHLPDLDKGLQDLLADDTKSVNKWEYTLRTANFLTSFYDCFNEAYKRVYSETEYLEKKFGPIDEDTDFITLDIPDIEDPEAVIDKLTRDSLNNFYSINKDIVEALIDDINNNLDTDITTEDLLNDPFKEVASYKDVRDLYIAPDQNDINARLYGDHTVAILVNVGPDSTVNNGRLITPNYDDLLPSPLKDKEYLTETMENYRARIINRYETVVSFNTFIGLVAEIHEVDIVNEFKVKTHEIEESMDNVNTEIARLNKYYRLKGDPGFRPRKYEYFINTFKQFYKYPTPIDSVLEEAREAIIDKDPVKAGGILRFILY